MLVVHPNSTCDVCLESYSNGAHAPHTITCGHVFCASCIESLAKPICPLCRTMFEDGDVRKLHVDRTQSPRVPLLTTGSPPNSAAVPVPSRSPTGSSISPTASSQEARRYQHDITRIVKEGAPASELGTLISRCHMWLKTQAPDQHEDLRISFLLLYNLTETQRKLAAEAEAVRSLRTECEELKRQFDVENRQLKAERDVAIKKYAELEETRADERETALAVENSLREHYLQISKECSRLRDELKHAKYPLSPNSDSVRAVDVRYIYADPPTGKSGPGDAPLKAVGSKLSKLAKVDMFHLSPLPVNIPSLPSTLMGFSALEDDDEEDFKSIDPPTGNPKSAPYEPFSSIDPVPIPGKAHAPRISSGLAMTAPKTTDWEPVRPNLFKGHSPSSSCSTSPTKETPLRERAMSHASDTAKPRDTSLGRQYSLREETRSRGPVDQQRRRVQLQDLLDSSANSTSASLPAHSHVLAIMSSGTSPPRSFSSQSHTSSIGSKPSPPPPPPLLSQRPPLISHASSAAIQLERDRQREKEREREREKEREREREREQKEREQEQERERRQMGPPNPLRDTTVQRMGSIGRAAGKNKIYS